MASGRVLWFSHEKGFGIIEADDGVRFLVDHTAIRANGSSNGDRPEFRTLEKGVPVEYEIREDSRGRTHAVEVRVSES